MVSPILSTEPVVTLAAGVVAPPAPCRSRGVSGFRCALAAPPPRVVDWPFVWAVPSESEPDEEHHVDLSHYGGNGECSCPHFTMTIAKILRAEAGDGFDTRCKHITAALCALASAMVSHQMDEDARKLGLQKETAGWADWPLKPGWND